MDEGDLWPGFEMCINIFILLIVNILNLIFYVIEKKNWKVVVVCFKFNISNENKLSALTCWKRLNPVCSTTVF